MVIRVNVRSLETVRGNTEYFETFPQLNKSKDARQLILRTRSVQIRAT